MHSWHSTRPPSPSDQHSEGVFVLSGLAWLRTLHMVEDAAAGAASSTSVSRSVCHSVWLLLVLSPSFSCFLTPKEGTESIVIIGDGSMCSFRSAWTCWQGPHEKLTGIIDRKLLFFGLNCDEHCLTNLSFHFLSPL